jgi:hypothetical protein
VKRAVGALPRAPTRPSACKHESKHEGEGVGIGAGGKCKQDSCTDVWNRSREMSRGNESSYNQSVAGARGVLRVACRDELWVGRRTMAIPGGYIVMRCNDVQSRTGPREISVHATKCSYCACRATRHSATPNDIADVQGSPSRLLPPPPPPLPSVYLPHHPSIPRPSISPLRPTRRHVPPPTSSAAAGPPLPPSPRHLLLRNHSPHTIKTRRVAPARHRYSARAPAVPQRPHHLVPRADAQAARIRRPALRADGLESSAERTQRDGDGSGGPGPVGPWPKGGL